MNRIHEFHKPLFVSDAVFKLIGEGPNAWHRKSSVIAMMSGEMFQLDHHHPSALHFFPLVGDDNRVQIYDLAFSTFEDGYLVELQEERCTSDTKNSGKETAIPLSA